MKIIKTISSLFSWLVVAVVFLISLTLVLSRFNTPINLRVFSVLSGSMEPEISTGDLVIAYPQPTYDVGQIVTIEVEGSGDTVTHRIFEKNETNGTLEYLLKGDANDSPDSEPILHESIIGKVIFQIPVLGRVVNFAQSQLGFILLIIIPAVILVYSEILNIKKEAHRLIKERRKRKLNLIEKAEVEIGEEIEKIEQSVK